MPTDPGCLLLIGAGDRQYRGAALGSLLAVGPVVVVDLATRDLAWVRAMGAEVHPVRDMTEKTLTAAADGLRRERSDVIGVLTLNEFYISVTATIAERLKLPHTPVAALRACRDKSLMRERFLTSGVPSPLATKVHSEAEAIAAAAAVGYPVVFKPTDLAGSVGVTRVDDVDALRSTFGAINGMTDRQLGIVAGPFLIEEFVDGPEFSVEIAVRRGVPRTLAVTRKTTGLSPFFEETQHIVETRITEHDIVEVAEQAVRALGIEVGVAHVEVRRGPRGPRVIEAAARVGGDMISQLVLLATGHDLSAWAGHLAADRPDPEPAEPAAPVAAVRFVYPREDVVVQSLELAPAQPEPGLVLVDFEAHPGDEMLLPPRGFLSRLGFAIVSADTIESAVRALDEIEERVVLNGRRLDEVASAHG